MKTLSYSRDGMVIKTLHGNLLAHSTIGIQIKGTWNDEEGWYDDPLHTVEYNQDTIYITVPDAVETTDIDTIVEDSRV